MNYFKIPVLVACFFFFGLFVHAATDDFTIRTVVGSDTTPPTTPTGLTATPVAVSQINLSWTASTDDFLLSGYQVFRDDVQIATTTLTTYSDSSLTENTSYSYYVTAFDSSGNVSGSSTPAATTTLSTATSTPTTTPSSGNDGKIELIPLPLEIISLEVITSTSSATLRFETRGYVRPVIKWGKTSEYELGSLASGVFKKVHETTIHNLNPGTVYSFTIEGENYIGLYGVLTRDTFITQQLERSYVPTNVDDFTAVRDGKDIVLTWNNPTDPLFDRVRILRNNRFYPGDQFDGWLVYEGSGDRVRDDGAALPGSVQYYTAFAYTHDGAVSSGAIVALQIGDDGVVRIDIQDVGTTSSEVIDDQTLFDTLLFVQDGIAVPVHERTVSIDGAKQLTITIAADALPRRLKSIIMTIYDSSERSKQFSFLLRMNEAKTAYIAHVAPFGISGTFPFVLNVFDYSIEKTHQTSGVLESEIVFLPPKKEEGQNLIFYELAQVNYLPIFLLFLVLLLLIARRLILRG